MCYFKYNTSFYVLTKKLMKIWEYLFIVMNDSVGIRGVQSIAVCGLEKHTFLLYIAL